MKHHGFTHTEIELHHDGSATIEHHHEKGAQHNKRYAVPDLDGIHDGLEDHLRVDPDAKEDEEERVEEELHPGIHEQVKKIEKGE